jgi:Zn-dependent peptidase ImmA (M78 family)
MNGLSKFDEGYIERLPKREQKIEKFCNAFAAEILIPATDFARRVRSSSSKVERMSDTFFETLSGFYSVSREVILRRFLDGGKISRQFYENKAKQWTPQQKKKSGGDYYLNLKTYLSDNLSKEVFSRYYQGRLTKDEASEYLGIKLKQFDSLEERMLRGMEA